MTTLNDTAIALDLTWAELDHHSVVLAEDIRQDGVPHVVVGILRGGMVPAVLLAHRLGIRDVRGLGITRTLTEGPNGAKAAHPHVTNADSLGALAANADVLLVDDVAGSGGTLDMSAWADDTARMRVSTASAVIITSRRAAAVRRLTRTEDIGGVTDSLAAGREVQDRVRRAGRAATRSRVMGPQRGRRLLLR